MIFLYLYLQFAVDFSKLYLSNLCPYVLPVTFKHTQQQNTIAFHGVQNQQLRLLWHITDEFLILWMLLIVCKYITHLNCMFYG
jgi:hypothetical protein